jgi:hexosaminidase
MNRIRLIIIISFAVFASSLACAKSAGNTKPFTIPELKEWFGGVGSFSITKDTRIVLRNNTKELERIGYQLSQDYVAMFGTNLKIIVGRKAREGDIFLDIRNDKHLGEEGYRIFIRKVLSVEAQNARGLFWATRTLLQLCETCRGKLPCGKAIDIPDYSLRGLMLDCGRKFFPISYLRNLVKVMAYYKMNTLHLHLNDNGFKECFNNDWNQTYSAFRLESEIYPGLAAKDGFYTKKQFVKLQELADSVGVEIIPEIDIPGHSLCFVHYKPEIGSKEYGLENLDLFKPKTYQFLDALFREYLQGPDPVFRGPRVHIGTDEYPNAKQAIVEKFRYFTDYYTRFVEGFGKQACVWGALDIKKGTTPVKSENVVLSAWYNGYADPSESIKKGYKLISIPDEQVYIVPGTVPGFYSDYLDIRKLYLQWTPSIIGKAVFPERTSGILGGMFAVWTDYVGNGITVKDIHYRIMPALQTLSTKMWDGKRVSLSFNTFDTLRTTLSEAPGVNELCRIGDKRSIVLNCDTLMAGRQFNCEGIGFSYTISFHIAGASEKLGTVLFSSDCGTFYLTDPISGMMGYARDGDLFKFRYKIMPGENADIRIEGTSRTIRLFVNGKLVDDMNVYPVYYKHFKSGQWSYKMVNMNRTMFFPLQQTGMFKSYISNFKVYNYIPI